MSKLYEPSRIGRRDGSLGGEAELLISLRDSSESSVAAGEFSSCFVDAAAFALALPFVLKDGFFIKLRLLILFDLQM